MPHPGVGFPIPPFQWPHVGRQWPTYNVESDQADGLVFWMPWGGSYPGSHQHADQIGRLALTEGGTPTWAFDGERGWSMEFVAGSSEYLYVAAAPVLTYPIAMSCWFRPVDINLETRLIQMGAHLSASYQYRALSAMGYNNYDKVYAQEHEFGPTATAQSTSTYTHGAWHHACGLFISQTSRAAFLDGANKGTNITDPGSLTTPDYTSIGAGRSSDVVSAYSGRIADVRIYNRLFNDTQAWQLCDPATRWELYQIPRRLWRLGVVAVEAPTGTAAFQSALREVAAYVAAGQAALGMASAYTAAFQSALKEAVSSSVAGQAALRGVSSIAAAVNAAFTEAYANTAAFAASLGESVSATAPYQAVLGMATSTAVAFQSVLSEVAAVTAAANAVFTEVVAKAAAFNASLSESVGASAAAQAALKMVSTFTAAGRAALAEARSTTIAGYAVLGEVVATTVAAAARLVSAGAVGVVAFAASLQELVASTAAGRAAIAGVTSVTAAVSSRLASLISAAVGLRAALGAATAQTVATRAYLSRVVAADMVLFARPLTASAKARPVSAELFRRTLASEVPDR